MEESTFEWDEEKDRQNLIKHGVSFSEALEAFKDPARKIILDLKHSQFELRHYCFGLDAKKERILTVRFTYRSGKIRIIGAGYWRQGRKSYGKKT